MCINCLPPPAEVLGNNLEPTPIGVGGTDISGALRKPITQPARTHGYFTWSQRGKMVHHPWWKTQNAQVKQRGQNPIWGHKLKPRSKQEVPSQKKSGRGWANKARVQSSSPPTNDSMTPSQTKFGRRISKKPKAQVGWSLSLSPAVLHKKQLDDPDIGRLLRWKESGQRPFGPEVCASSPATRHYWNCWELLQIQDGMLMCHFVRCDATGDHMQFIVPRSLHNKVLYHIHDSLLGGHLGQKKTREKRPPKGFPGVVLGRIAIIGFPNVMNVLK